MIANERAILRGQIALLGLKDEDLVREEERIRVKSRYTNGTRLIAYRELLALLGISVGGFYALRKSGRKEFPHPVDCDSVPRWLESEVLEWLRTHRR